MNAEESQKICSAMVPERNSVKLAVLKKAIREGTYKVKAEDIAEKIIKDRLFGLALDIYNHKYQRSRNKYFIAWTGNKTN